ncbi:MAG: class I SAM-dependent methyltransferase, partial [Lachnospiraceae bacterium]|nr:class I SAM-dependent methyltransferase [Lachnospiraceae bacterium]
GAITGALARRAGSVTCIDLSKKRSLVNAHRNKEYDNITIKVGNFRDIEPHLDEDFDYVLLIGVFEYGQAYIGGDTPYEDFMRICNRHRKEDGRLIIAIENKFGLKYWAGCREDHLGTYFSGLEGYHEGGSARTFTRRGLEDILERVGICEYSFYYPYPDYKFMTTVYSDRYLPKKGELSNNLRNFDRERVLLFDEKQVFDEIIAEKEFPLFSNSYLLVAGVAPDVIYTKFSNARAPKWAIQTKMVQRAPEQIQVEKIPHTAAAYGHMQNTQKAYALLAKRYEGTKIEMNKCSEKDGNVENGLVFEYCSGVTLEAMLDECLSRADMEGFRALVDEYM